MGLEGVNYELDLSDKNAQKLREQLAPWLAAARRTGGRHATKSNATSTNVDLKAVRAWAASNGVDISSRGRVPASVIEQYHAAGN